MQRNNKFGAKLLIWRQLLAKKKMLMKFLSGVGTSPRECHLPLKVIDSCRPCITSHNSVADGVKPEHTSDMRRPKQKTASLRVTETAL